MQPEVITLILICIAFILTLFWSCLKFFKWHSRKRLPLHVCLNKDCTEHHLYYNTMI